MKKPLSLLAASVLLPAISYSQIDIQCQQLQPGVSLSTVTVGGNTIDQSTLESMGSSARAAGGFTKGRTSQARAGGPVAFYVYGQPDSKVSPPDKLEDSPGRASGTVTFSFDYSGDGGTEGFNDTTAASPEGGNPGTTLGELRQNALEEAATFWADRIDGTITIEIAAEFNSLFCDDGSGTATLGSAGATNFYTFGTASAPYVTDTFYPVALVNQAINSDANGATEEIFTQFNSDIDTGCLTGVSFYYGYDGNPGAFEIDFYTTILHEIGHGLGITSLADLTTADADPADGSFPGNPSIYDVNLYDEDLSNNWGAPAGGTTMTDGERLGSATNTGDLTWSGSGVDDNSGFLTTGTHGTSGRVLMYAPASLEPGSSVSHFDTSLSPNELMEPVLTSSYQSDLATGLLFDLDWRGPGLLPVSLDQFIVE